MMEPDVFVLADPQPKTWGEAVNAGCYFNCPEAGGWLRQVPNGALLIEDVDKAADLLGDAVVLEVLHAIREGGLGWRRDMEHRSLGMRLLRAALGEG